MNILRYSMICFVSLAIILMVGSSYSIQDNDKDYALARNYGPGWVIPSVLDTNGKSRISDSTQKLNDLEKNLANNPNKADNSEPVLQKKRGAEGGTNKVLPSNVVGPDDGAYSGIPRGSGTDQYYVNGNLYSEKISGQWIVYAGFDNPNQEQNAIVIQKAIEYASMLGGGKVLVREGTYSGPITVSDGISLYGGYDNYGNRDINTNRTTMNGGFSIDGISRATEINGFSINRGIDIVCFGHEFSYGMLISNSSNIKIINNTFDQELYDGIIIGKNSSQIFVKNNIFNSQNSLGCGAVYQYSDNIVAAIISNNRWTSYVEIIGNQINSGTMDFNVDGLTTRVENNVFNKASIRAAAFSNTNGGLIVNSSNNNYAGSVQSIMPTAFSHIISTNDYFNDISYSMPTNVTIVGGSTRNDANDLTAATAYNLANNPLGSTQGQVTNPIDTTTQFISIFSPSYYPDKLFSGYGFKFDQYNDLSNTPIQAIGLDINIFDPSSLTFSLKELNPGNMAPGAIAIDLGKLADSYILTLKDKLGIPLNDIATLQDTILVLETKENKTDTEQNLLEVAKLLEENSQYLDDETLKEFNQIARVVEMTEDMKDLMKPEDLISLSKSLQKLVEEERGIYSDYLTKTKDIYNKLIQLLGISVNDENLPDIYTSLSKINASAKRKMIVDRTLERLKAKDKDTLKDNEKEALKMDQNILRPEREECKGKLKMLITTFAWDIGEILKNKESAYSTKEGSTTKAFMMLDNKELSKATQ